ncbi:hypothetical protein AC482_05820 [miscellaneous Crenarchaeota group-15 archaeon DG-45]|uniref:Uncharacterized protein n=1 Tax=miscellaneous Crenarchaeota group-15 archaeon DG-45 TaxID=1685127 RepID=A0A0M0BMZ9_9ARCH|nr:MAG: hypothetical protein AC482_05820 [miscellaneous Crenarchaeota group-15 archaeon DG-45]
MSAESTLIPEDILSSEIPREPEGPLNAEEATMIVLDFLERLGRKVTTPKSATLEEDVFVVEVDLRREAARVRVNQTTREIIEYSITASQGAEEAARPLPVPSRRTLMIAFGLIASACAFIALRYLDIPFLTIFEALTGQSASDLLIVGGFCAIPVVVFVIWWRRRS